MKSQREQMREERAKICASQEGLHPASSMNIKQSTLACSTPCQHMINITDPRETHDV